MDQRHPNTKAIIAVIAAQVGNDRGETVRKLAQAHGRLTKMVYATLHKDLKLSGKLASRYPNC